METGATLMSTTCTEPKTIRVPMGGLKFAESPAVLETLLGSCVGIAMWDERSGYGGLAHAMLPDSKGQVADVGKFVNSAVSRLKNRLLKRGASPYSLRAKVAGGATMFGENSETVGTKNCKAALDQLQRQEVRVVAKHVGGNKGRVIRFSLSDRSVEVEMARTVIDRI